MRALPVLVGLLLLVGCVTPQAPREATEAAASSEVTTAAVVAPGTPPPAPTLAPERFPLQYQGTTATWMCAPSGPSSCMGADVPGSASSQNTFYIVELAGLATAAELVLAWEAATPATEKLSISVFTMRSCGDNCFEMGDDTYFMANSGTSPVTLAANDIRMLEGQTLGVHVANVRPTPPLPAPFFYGVEQAFAVEGVVTALVPVPATV